MLRDIHCCTHNNYRNGDFPLKRCRIGGVPSNMVPFRGTTHVHTHAMHTITITYSKTLKPLQYISMHVCSVHVNRRIVCMYVCIYYKVRMYVHAYHTSQHMHKTHMHILPGYRSGRGLSKPFIGPLLASSTDSPKGLAMDRSMVGPGDMRRV